jgi:acylphosphatase
MAKAGLAVRVTISGTVQGVSFRAWTVEEAGRRGLRGWVRNRRDGGVEAVFAGETAAVRAMVAACHRGPPAARVASVREEPAADEGFAGFEQRPTA